MLKIHKQPFIQEVFDKRLNNVKLFIKREDVIHPLVSGNKWRKLKYNLLAAKEQGHHTLLTFGGGHSNHIYATAAAAKETGFNSIGVIRGEELKYKPLNPTLDFASVQGMKLHFVSRSAYRDKMAVNFVDQLKDQFGHFFLIPEGGTNILALKGAAEMVDEEIKKFDYVCCSVGTGGPVAGLIQGMQGHGEVFGFSALKGGFLKDEVQRLIGKKSALTNWQIIDDYHFGGYAKTTSELRDFTDDFYERHNILIEPIYTGKTLFGVFDLIQKGIFKIGSRILVVHTGGLRPK
ncbi:MAG: pyridoxal-phosphate dependent enzyme [Bacteroidota bacterium]